MDIIHDSTILNYQINFECSKIEVTVVTEKDIQLKISFEDLFAFHFENQLPDSILLDVVEANVNYFATDNKELLDKSKNYFWPMEYEYIEEIINFIKENSYKYYKLQASYGLNGWVLAKRVFIK